MIDTVNLENVIDPSFFQSSLYQEIHIKYFQFEDLVSKELASLGYRLHGNWFSVEKDKFGPLIRGVYATKNGQQVLINYA